MALCPFAEHKLIDPGSNDPPIDVIGAILHVDAGDAPDLYDYFRYRSGGIESHFHIRRDGHIIQMRDTGFEADANYKANSFYDNGYRKGYVSIETQGYGEGEWTPEQLASIKKLLAWLAETHDFPLRECEHTQDPGVGYHTLFGSPSPWTPVAKSCPGPDRKRQFHTNIVPWMNAGAPIEGEDEMPTPADLWDAPLPEYDNRTDRSKVPARVLLAQAHNRAGDARAAAKRTERAVKALAKALGPEVEAAVAAALEEALPEVIDVIVTPRAKDDEDAPS